MSLPITVRDDAGARAIAAGDLPIGIRADGSIAGAGEREAAAWIGVDREHPFVQPAGGGARVLVGGETIAAARWLADGDEIRVGGGRIRCALDGAGLVLDVDGSDAAPTLVPPSAPPPARPAERDATPGPEPEPVPIPQQPPPPRRRLRPPPRRGVRALVLGAFAVLVAAALFVFLSAPVEIRIAPAPERIEVDGILPGVEVAGRRLLLPGEYAVRAQRPGYRPLAARVGVERGAENRFAFELEKLPGRVAIRTEPAAGVEIAIDGAPVGTTPLEAIELPAGEHAIAARAPRHLDAERTVDVVGLGREQTVAVELVPAWAPVSFASAPEGATVRVDGRAVGATPLTVDLDAGAHAVEIAKPSYAPWRIAIEVEPDVPLAVRDVVLVPAPGRLALETVPAGATVAVDGDYRGTTPLALELAPNEPHFVELRLAGHVGSDRRITLAPDESRKLAVRLAPRTGTVLVSAEPPDAELLIDGEPAGTAMQRLELPARAHRLTIRRAGYVPFETTITPRAGVSQRVDVVLEREAGAAAAGPATTPQGRPLVRVEPARFAMGASRGEPGRRGNEILRVVEITRPYLLAAHEVTNAEFREFRPDHRSGAAGGESLDGDDRPVVSVTWDDAARYANWLSERAGLEPAYVVDGETVRAVRPPTAGYRLPTEAEWALAARYAGAPSGEPARYPWGESFPPPAGAGNYADASAADLVPNVIAGYRDGFPATAPVGRFPANPIGVFDLGGNVAEWCHDHYAIDSDARGEVVKDPIGPESGRHRVVRGASWRHSSIGELRASYRDYAAGARDDLGFRVARYAR